MSYFVFRKDLWTQDLIVALLAGAFLGYEVQRVADSGETIYEKLLMSTLVGLFSYLLAFTCGYLVRNSFSVVPSWIWLGVFGSILFAFNRAFVSYLFTNWESRGILSTSEYFLWLLPDMMKSFLLSSILYTFFMLAVLFAARFVAYWLFAYRKERTYP